MNYYNMFDASMTIFQLIYLFIYFTWSNKKKLLYAISHTMCFVTTYIVL